jgi:hypothetical protein
MWPNNLFQIQQKRNQKAGSEGHGLINIEYSTAYYISLSEQLILFCDQLSTQGSSDPAHIATTQPTKQNKTSWAEQSHTRVSLWFFP